MSRFIEPLEYRRFHDGAAAEPLAEAAAAPDLERPTLDTVRVLGPWQAATGLALTFSEPMDPAAATDVTSYRVWGTVRRRAFDRDQRKLPLARADYDDASRTVTLVPAQPTFNVRRFLRNVFVHPSVTDAAGNRLTGDREPLSTDLGLLDGYVPFVFRAPRVKRSFSYQDANRSQVRLRLRGPGRAMLLLRAQGARLDDEWPQTPVETWGEGMQLFIDGATPRTVLTGSVVAPPGGDGTTTLAEIVNPGGAQLPLLSDPAFGIGSVRT